MYLEEEEDTTVFDIAIDTAGMKGVVVRKIRLGDLSHSQRACGICNEVVGKEHFHFYKKLLN
jgi:hypothetical protein